MPFLADESCDFAIVRALRGAGADVAAVSEDAPGAEDEAVLEMARGSGRVLLTEDKDFGQLVYAAGQPTGGVILLRYPMQARALMVREVIELSKTRGSELAGAFVVMEPGRTRFARRRQRPSE